MTDKDFTFQAGSDLLQPKVAVKAKIPPKPAGLTKVANAVWEDVGSVYIAVPKYF